MNTKHYIVYKFDEMLDYCTYEDLTVKQICVYANISRSTFYRYFQDINDLAISLYQQNAEKVFSHSTDKSYHQIMMEHGKLLLDKKYKSMILNYYHNNPTEFMGYVSDNFFQFSENNYKAKYKKDLPPNESFQLLIFMKGIAYLIIEILLGIVDLSLEELVDKADLAKPNFLNTPNKPQTTH